MKHGFGTVGDVLTAVYLVTMMLSIGIGMRTVEHPPEKGYLFALRRPLKE